MTRINTNVSAMVARTNLERLARHVPDHCLKVAHLDTGSPAENQRVKQRITAQSVGAVNRYTGTFTGCKQSLK